MDRPSNKEILSPRFLASLYEPSQEPRHIFSGPFSTLALAFDHASGDEGCPRAGRFLEERPDMHFGLNGVLVHAQDVLHGAGFVDET